MTLTPPVRGTPGTTHASSILGWSHQRSPWLPVLVAILCYLGFIARTAFPVHDEVYFSLFDDAMISMRYARNLAAGHGLVWNSSQPPVEGYTNFLWTLWMAVLHLAPVPESKISLLVMLSGALILVANVLVVGRIAGRLMPQARFGASLAMWFTALYYPLIYWTLRGMEVGLITLLISLAILLALHVRDSFHVRTLLTLAIVMGLGILTRTDVIIPCLSVAGFVFLTARSAHRRQVALVLGGFLIGTLAIHTVFRLLYYGHPFPNTYYLKVYGFNLSTRLSWGLLHFARVSLVHLHAPLALAAAYLAIRRRTLPPASYLLALIFLGQCVYSIYVGGDVWEWMRYANRYLTVGMPSLLVLNVLGIETLLHTETRLRPARLLACWFALAVVLGVLAWCWSAGIGLSASRHPLFLKLAQQALPGKLSTITLACFCFLLLVLPRLRLSEQLAGWLGPARQSGGLAGALLAILLVVAMNGEAIGLAAFRNACHVDDDAEMARYGLTLREVTAEQATIAVAWAGAIPYFSHRPAVDLLGKNDYIVATSPPLPGRFTPGHNKQNLVYSIGQLRPDVVAQFPGDPLVIEAYGYDQVARTVFVRADSQLVDRVAFTEAIRRGRIPRLPRQVPLCQGE